MLTVRSDTYVSHDSVIIKKNLDLVYADRGYFMINALLQALGEVCQAERFVQKRLVVKSYHDGHQLLKTLARYNVAWLNVVTATPFDLAMEVAGQALFDENIETIDDGDTLCLVSQVLEEMRGRGELKYFADLESLEGPEGVLKGALMELRMAGVAADSLDAGLFVDGQKGKELKMLLAGFEKKLNEQNLADGALVYKKAAEILAKAGQPGNVLYLIPEQLEFDRLTYDFLEALSAGKRRALPAEAVCGLSRPEGLYFQSGQEPESKPEPRSPLSWLYAQDDAPDGVAPDIYFFQVSSPACEVKEVFRRLLKAEIKADQALLCYTNSDTYLPLVHSVAEVLSVPVTYAEGLPAVFTRPGKLLSGLLDWVEDSYSAIHIYRLLVSGGVRTNWANLQAELLRRAAVGWGRERYATCLEKLKHEVEKELRKAEAAGRNIHYQSTKLDHFPKLEQLITTLLEEVPEENTAGQVRLDQLCRGLANIIEKYAHTAGELDREARESILELLDQLARSKPEPAEYQLALKRLRKRLKALRVGASLSEPGCLHVAPVGRAEWLDRDYSFLVGLGGNYFPGGGLQDAVLLDRERENISPDLTLYASGPERNLYSLNRFLAAKGGSLTMSFSCFEPVEGRPAFPAAVMLQAYRLKCGRPDADYEEFFNNLGPPVAYYPASPGQALAVSEWWLSEVLGGHKKGDQESVKDCYPRIKDGLTAEDIRRSDLFTEYDGKVIVDPARIDPRCNSNKSLSASAIEKLAGCPYAYFLKYLLYINPPEEQAYDRWAWLDVMERGTLLHAIYARYLRAVCGRTGSPQEDRGELFRIAENEIAKKKADSPPPSEVVFQSEKNQLLRELETFLKCEQQLWQEGSVPLYLEVPFGRGPEAVQEAGIGREDAVEHDLPGGDKIKIRGSIDRIDRLPGQDLYRVWDFKTGGTSIYRHSDHIKQGRQIQPALYTSAAEVILRDRYPGAVVKDAGYLFPTEKGEGQKYLREQDRRDEAGRAVELMLDQISEGAFCAAENKDKDYPPCNFCDYQAVCRYPQVLTDHKLKKENPGNTILEPWKELQKYE